MSENESVDVAETDSEDENEIVTIDFDFGVFGVKSMDENVKRDDSIS